MVSTSSGRPAVTPRPRRRSSRVTSETDRRLPICRRHNGGISIEWIASCRGRGAPTVVWRPPAIISTTSRENYNTYRRAAYCLSLFRHVVTFADTSRRGRPNFHASEHDPIRPEVAAAAGCDDTTGRGARAVRNDLTVRRRTTRVRVARGFFTICAMCTRTRCVINFRFSRARPSGPCYWCVTLVIVVYLGGAPYALSLRHVFLVRVRSRIAEYRYVAAAVIKRLGPSDLLLRVDVCT